MAFGFGFNKAKVLAAADRHIQQGKLHNAITEYEGYKLINDEAVIAARPDAILAMERASFRLDAKTVFEHPAFATTPAAAQKELISMREVLGGLAIAAWPMPGWACWSFSRMIGSYAISISGCSARSAARPGPRSARSRHFSSPWLASCPSSPADWTCSCLARWKPSTPA